MTHAVVNLYVKIEVYVFLLVWLALATVTIFFLYFIGFHSANVFDLKNSLAELLGNFESCNSIYTIDTIVMNNSAIFDSAERAHCYIYLYYAIRLMQRVMALLGGEYPSDGILIAYTCGVCAA